MNSGISSFEILDGIAESTSVLRMRFAKLQAEVERLKRELAEERGLSARIAHGHSGGWISVAEREPERNVTVLVWDCGTTKTARIVKVFGTPIGWLSASSGYQIYPTHWMPLPEPPKVGQVV